MRPRTNSIALPAGARAGRAAARPAPVCKRGSGMNFEPVQRVLDAHGIRYALIGAHAMAVRGYPRSTVDIDLLTADARVLDDAIWAACDRTRRPLTSAAGTPTTRSAASSTSCWPMPPTWTSWWRDGNGKPADRARRAVALTATTVPVPPRGDLVLLKLAPGGYTDLQDAGRAARPHRRR